MKFKAKCFTEYACLFRLNHCLIWFQNIRELSTFSFELLLNYTSVIRRYLREFVFVSFFRFVSITVGRCRKTTSLHMKLTSSFLFTQVFTNSWNCHRTEFSNLISFHCLLNTNINVIISLCLRATVFDVNQ